MNNIIYFDNCVPKAYLSGSRDFQLLAHLMTVAINSARINAQSQTYLNESNLINDRLIPLLQTKVGFFTNFDFKSDALRLVCDSFCYLIRNKGSELGIVQAIEIFLRTQGISTNFYVDINNTTYSITIGINSTKKLNNKLLMEILKYILPTGYYLSIFYYEDLSSFIDFTNENNYVYYKDEVEHDALTSKQSSGTIFKYVDGQIQRQSYAGLLTLDLTTFYDPDQHE